MCLSTCIACYGWVGRQQEMEKFQNRLATITGECNYRAKDMIIPGLTPDEEKIRNINLTLNACLKRAYDSHLGMLNGLEANLKNSLSRYG